MCLLGGFTLMPSNISEQPFHRRDERRSFMVCCTGVSVSDGVKGLVEDALLVSSSVYNHVEALNSASVGDL